MKQTKFMLSLGLAYFEQKEMERLNKKSLEGWHFKKFSFMGYTLEKGESEDVIYTIDYHLLKKDDHAEYYHMFQLAGWEHVCSGHNLHIFKAPRGTKPIYSDKETTVEKYDRMQKWWGNMSLIFLSLLIISLLLTWQAKGILLKIGDIGFGLGLIISVPSTLTYLAITIRKMKMKKEV